MLTSNLPMQFIGLVAAYSSNDLLLRIFMLNFVVAWYGHHVSNQHDNSSESSFSGNWSLYVTEYMTLHLNLDRSHIRKFVFMRNIGLIYSIHITEVLLLEMVFENLCITRAWFVFSMSTLPNLFRFLLRLFTEVEENRLYVS